MYGPFQKTQQPRARKSVLPLLFVLEEEVRRQDVDDAQGQQDLYANMRRQPEKYPIISWVKNMNLTPAEQRQYSNLWYRQFGTSQALPVNDNWGGFFIAGSEVHYTN